MELNQREWIHKYKVGARMAFHLEHRTFIASSSIFAFHLIFLS